MVVPVCMFFSNVYAYVVSKCVLRCVCVCVCVICVVGLVSNSYICQICLLGVGVLMPKFRLLDGRCIFWVLLGASTVCVCR